MQLKRIRLNTHFHYIQIYEFKKQKYDILQKLLQLKISHLSRKLCQVCASVRFITDKHYF